MNLNNIFLGILAAAILLFIRNAILTAQRQKNISTQLSAYLRYWRRIVLDNNLFSLFYMGVEWNKEMKELAQKGGSAEDLFKLEKEKREIINEIKANLEKDSSAFEESLDLMKSNIKRLPTKVWDNLVSNITIDTQNLIEGKTFISDEQASCLHPYVADVCIDLKMKLVTVTTNFMILSSIIRENPDGFEIKNYSEEISNLIWQGFLISKDIDTLSNIMEEYANKSVFFYAARNMRL